MIDPNEIVQAITQNPNATAGQFHDGTSWRLVAIVGDVGYPTAFVCPRQHENMRTFVRSNGVATAGVG